MSTAPGTALAIHRNRMPDADPWFIEAVVGEWYEQYREDEAGGRDFAIEGSKWRGSWAGSCARQIAYKVAGVEETNPTTVADAWRFWLGKLLHDQVQAQVLKKFPGSTVETKVRIGEDGSGHADALVVTPEGKRVLVEMKSINGTGYKMSTIGRYVKRRAPEGARVSAIMQGAMYAAAMDPLPDELVVAYFALEVVSKKDLIALLPDEYARFAAQWTFSQEEFLTIANDEIRRMERIVKVVERSGPGAVPRIVPDPNMPPHRITNPRWGAYDIVDEDGNVLGKDRAWVCQYCSHRDQCITDMEAGQ